MCGRYIIKESDNEITELIKTAADSNAVNFRFGEIFPSAFAPIIINSGNVEFLKWGVPSFNNVSVINSKSETIFEKPMWKQSIMNFRCVVPCSGFFEWNKHKQKILFNNKNNHTVYLAGLYKIINNEKFFSIITTSADNTVGLVHDRMPVILSKDDINIWLSNNNKFMQCFNKQAEELVITEFFN